jgi:2Fe-2S ferredoxin
MVKIIIENLAQKELVVTDLNKTILQHLQTNFIDWRFECGGKGRCTTCKMIILKGMESLNDPTPAEWRYRHAHQLNNDERLACQTKTAGDIIVRVPEESKLPHIRYSS